MTPFDPSKFAPSIAALLREERLAPLNAGRPDAALRPLLEALHGPEAFAPHRLRDEGFASACRAGLWLYFDFLDESHTVSQELSTPEGSYWHALMHRREPDFTNSKYWFRRVGSHPIFESLRVEGFRLATDAADRAGFLTKQTSWDPFAFVDLCEVSWHDEPALSMLCRRIQHREWQLLFGHCYRKATET